MLKECLLNSKLSFIDLKVYFGLMRLAIREFMKILENLLGVNSLPYKILDGSCYHCFDFVKVLEEGLSETQESISFGRIIKIVLYRVSDIYLFFLLPLASHVGICLSVFKFHYELRRLLKNIKLRRGPGWVPSGWSIIPIHPGCGVDPCSGYLQESTSE